MRAGEQDDVVILILDERVGRLWRQGDSGGLDIALETAALCQVAGSICFNGDDGVSRKGTRSLDGDVPHTLYNAAGHF